MANYPQHRRGFDIDSSAPAAQKVTIDDKWKGHSVTGGATPGTIKLAGDGDEVWGSIAYFDSGQPVITDMGEDVHIQETRAPLRFRQAVRLWARHGPSVALRPMATSRRLQRRQPPEQTQVSE